MVFVIFKSFFLTSVSNEIENIMYSLVLPPKQVNCPQISSSNSFMIKW